MISLLCVAFALVNASANVEKSKECSTENTSSNEADMQLIRRAGLSEKGIYDPHIDTVESLQAANEAARAEARAERKKKVLAARKDDINFKPSIDEARKARADRMMKLKEERICKLLGLHFKLDV